MNEGQVCRICLGILQDCDTQENIDWMKSEIQKSDYEFNSFKFCLRIPNSIYIRTHKITLLTREKFPEEEYSSDVDFVKIVKNPKDGAIDIKTAFKWIMAPMLAQALSVKSNMDEQFTIDISYSNPKDEASFFQPFGEMIHKMKVSTLEKKSNEKKRKLEMNNKANSHIEPSASNIEVSFINSENNEFRS